MASENEKPDINTPCIEYHKNIDDIPELNNFSKNTIQKFVKLCGGFQLPNSLLKKEKKYLYKLEKLELKKQYDNKKGEPTKSKKSKRKEKDKKMSESNCKQRVAIDLSYFHDNLMKYTELRNCITQVKRCYSTNRTLSNPLQLHITSMKDKAVEILGHMDGYQNWDINFHDCSYLDVFNNNDIVYLTSESENIIETLDDTKVYVIGGLLDHNSLKGLSYNRAISQNLAHGRLPIDTYLDMKSLKVLTINQVFSIISSVANGMSWQEALLKFIPQRKAPIPKKL